VVVEPGRTEGCLYLNIPSPMGAGNKGPIFAGGKKKNEKGEEKSEL
jgi:hypothetical protein